MTDNELGSEMGGKHYWFDITNNTGASVAANDQIYLFLVTGGTTAWAIDHATGIARQLSQPGTLPDHHTTIHDLPPADDGQARRLRIDSTLTLNSIRLYFSTSKDTLTPAGNALNGPPPGQVAFYYDFVEFALDAAKQQVNIDLSQVDQFGFPFSLQVAPADPDYPDGSGFHPTLSRGALFTAYQSMASETLAAFADCVVPAAGAAPPYCLLAPQHVCANQFKAVGLIGTVTPTGGSGPWTASFQITGPGKSPPSNGGLLVKGMPVSGAGIPGGTTVSCLPDAPNGHTVLLQSTDGPFSSQSNLALSFEVLPTTKLATWFDQAIDSFFTFYKARPGALQIEQNNGQDTVYSATVAQVGGINSISGTRPQYTVLQFTPAPGSGHDQVFNIFYPFFSTNSPAGKKDPFKNPVPPPPYWWRMGLNINEPPSEMVFGADGVFADNTLQFSDKLNQGLLGALENAVVTGLARASIGSWRYVTGTIQPDEADAHKGTVTCTQPVPADIAGKHLFSFRLDNMPMRVNPSGVGGNTFLVYSPVRLKPTPNDLLTYFTMYPAGGTWSAYAWFMHNGYTQNGVPVKVTIGGRAYALPFDDQGGFSSDLTSTWSGTPSRVSITLNPW